MNMISYAMVGSTNLPASGDFFDKVLGVVGAERMMKRDTAIMWGAGEGKPFFAACLPHDGNVATHGNGTMISFGCETTDQVDAMYAAAQASGGSCEGKPGPRGEDEQYYVGYFRDPDGNKFAAFYMAG
jgi:predicted lactoylglutathione lyase